MAEIQLADLLPLYPAITDNNFQTLLASKEEFRQLRTSESEPPLQSRGEFYKHQKIIERFFREYDEGYLFHETGTGKSCVFAAVSEYFKKQRAKGGHIKRVYIVTRGPTLKSEIKKQLICRCTPESEYEAKINEKIRKGDVQKASGLKAMATNVLKQWYTITTYEKLAKQIAQYRGSDGDKRLIEDFSDIIIILDEVQYLTAEDSTSDSGINLEQDPEMALPEKPKSKAGMSKVDIYAQIKRLMHLIKRSKKIIASATIMINDPEEFVKPFNLILPPNFQLPNNIDWDEVTLQQLEPYLRGRVSYIRALNTGAYETIKGDPSEEVITLPNGTSYVSQLILDYSAMSKFQRDAFMTASLDNNYFSLKRRQASNFVYPNPSGEGPGVWGKVGFDNFVISENGSYRFRDDFANYIKGDLERIRQFSCKSASIIEGCIANEGNCFIFDQYITGSGLIALSLCFEAMGVQKFDESQSIFIGVGGQMKPFCSSESSEIKYLRDEFDIKKRPQPMRYVLLTGKTPDPKIDVLLEAMNCKENMNSNIIKIFITSPVGRDGINVNNVTRIDIFGGGWNRSNTYQAESRAKRANSHEDLIRQRIERGQDPRIEIEIHYHAAVAIADDEKTALGSIDIQLYNMSEAKDRRIKRILRMLKICAFDCHIHRGRNIRPGDQDGSAVCDYDICNYKCYNPPPNIDDIDYSSYDVLYSNDNIEEIIDNLKEFFSENSTATLEELRSYIRGSYHLNNNDNNANINLKIIRHVDKFTDLALERLVSNKLLILDHFGYNCFLREVNNLFYLERDYPSGKDFFELSYYHQDIITYRIKDLKEIALIKQINEQEDTIDRVKMLTSKAEIINSLENLPLSGKVELLEQAISNIVSGRAKEFDNIVYNRYSKYVFSIKEPVTEINRKIAEVQSIGKGSIGRPATVESKTRITNLSDELQRRASIEGESKGLVYEENTEQVYLHYLWIIEENQTKHGSTAKHEKLETRIRLFKPSEGQGWRDTNKYEAPIYSWFKQDMDREVKAKFDDKMIYGLVLHDGEFKLVNRYFEKPGSENDRRRKMTGSVCNKWNLGELYDTLWMIEGPYPPGYHYKPPDINVMINSILVYGKNRYKFEEVSKWPIERINFYYAWGYMSNDNKPKLTRDNICGIIKYHLEQQQAIRYTD